MRPGCDPAATRDRIAAELGAGDLLPAAVGLIAADALLALGGGDVLIGVDLRGDGLGLLRGACRGSRSANEGDGGGNNDERSHGLLHGGSITQRSCVMAGCVKSRSFRAGNPRK